MKENIHDEQTHTDTQKIEEEDEEEMRKRMNFYNL